MIELHQPVFHCLTPAAALRQELLPSGEDDGPIKLLRLAASLAGKMLAQPRFGQNPAHRQGHGLGIIRRDQQGILPVFQQIGNTPDIGADDAKPAGHGLHHADGSIVHPSRIQENISLI